MTSINPADIEREIETERSALAEALSDLQRQVSPEKLTSALSENLRSVAGEAVDSLTEAVRRHPVPAALAGLGLAWLAASAARSARDGEPHREPARQPAHEGAAPETATGLPPLSRDAPVVPVSDGALHRETLSMPTPARQTAMRDRLGEWGQRLGENAAELSNWLAEGTEGMSEAARDRIRAARLKALEAQQAAERAARQARRKIGQTAEENPLLLIGLALAGGAVAGALLPTTRREDETVGAWRDRLFDEAEQVYRTERARLGRMAEAAIDEGRAAVGEAMERAREAAPDPAEAVEELEATGRRIAGRVAGAARDAADKATTADA